MFIKRINTFLVIITICLLNITNSYANELAFWGSWETIKELKQSIDVLDKVNTELKNDFNELNTNYKLKTFLRNNLTRYEFLKIKKIVSEYNANIAEIEEKLLLNAKKWLPVLEERRKLLEEKRTFYNGLIPYINIDYRKEYLEYIRRDADLFKKQNIVSTDIEVKKEILDTKVTKIESEIIKHKEYIKDSVRQIIESRLDLKIKNLSENETFTVLNEESKVKVLDKTIRKIKIKLQNLENSRIKTQSWALIESWSAILENKIQTYKIAVDKLESFKETLVK